MKLLRHARIELALHELRSGDGMPLLILHGLGERTPDTLPERYSPWPGPVYGLDFTGHGRSTVPTGGGYTSEILMADADTALQELGQATVVGRGLGGYIALLLAGARPTVVQGTVICDGNGLAGGGENPGSPTLVTLGHSTRSPDPYALHELARDVRPADYAAAYARMSVQLSPLQEPIAVSAVVRPRWLSAVVLEPGVVELPLPEALALYAQSA